MGSEEARFPQQERVCLIFSGFSLVLSHCVIIAAATTTVVILLISLYVSPSAVSRDHLVNNLILASI